MSDMQFCKAQLRAVEAKVTGWESVFSIGELGILQTQVGASASAAPNKKSITERRADCGSWLAGLGAAADNAPLPRQASGVSVHAPSRELLLLAPYM